MRNAYLVFKREFGVLFTSPLAYVLFVLFLIISGIFFSAGLGTYVQYSVFIQMQQQMQQFGGAAQLPPFTDMVFGNFFRNTVVIFLFVLPLFTMRMFSEERRSGTEELLMTFPIRDIEIVLGKFLAALAAVFILLLLTLTYALMTDYITADGQASLSEAVLLLPKFLWTVIKVPFVWLFTDSSLATALSGGESGSGIFASRHLDAGPIFASYLGLFLAAFAFVALGIFASSLTEHQIVAANVTFAILLIFWMIGWIEDLTEIQFLKTAVKNVSFHTHLEPFIKGDPDYINFAYFIGIGSYFLFLTWVIQFWTRLGRGFVSVAKKSKLNVLWLLVGLGFVVTVNIRLIQGEWSPYAFVGIVFTLAAVAAWFALNTEWMSELIVSHGFLYTVMLGAMALLGLAVLCAGLYITDTALDILQRKTSFERHVDMTKIQKFSLAEQSRKILDSLDEEVNLVFIEDPNRPQSQRQAQELFGMYSRRNSERITVEFVDAEKNPARAEQFGPAGTVYFGDIYIEAGASGDRRRQKVERLEENDVTNGILKVVKLQSPKIYITTGHGEPDLEDTRVKEALGFLKDQLEKEVYEVVSLALYNETEVPNDCTALMIVGPKTPFGENEIGMLGQYLDRGGNLIVCIEPRTEPGLDPFLGFLDTYGVEVRNDLIVDPSLQNQLFGTFTSVVSSEYGIHNITEGMEQYASAFSFARTLKLKDELPNEAQGTELVKTGDRAWGETDLEKVLGSGEASPDPEDNKGPVAVAVALSWEPEVAGDVASGTDETTGLQLEDETPKSRLVVFGDANMVTNELMARNRNLVLNTLAWMSEREELVSIRPRLEFGEPVNITGMESRVIWAIGVMDVPILVLLAGIAVLVRRRVRG